MNTFLRIFILSLVFFANYIESYEDVNNLEDYINSSLKFWNVPGASIAIIKDDKVIMTKGFGHTKLEKIKANEVNEETLFPIASLTKSFTAVATGIFAEQQQITLESTIQSLWPSFQLYDEYVTNNLSLLDCISMRAGLTGPFDKEWWKQSYLTEKKLLEFLSKLSFPCGFRGCFYYQNLLYDIIGHVIEKNSGENWELFVKKNLLDVLAMNSTTTNFAAYSASNNKAFPHQLIENTIQEVPFKQVDVVAPAAGLSSNAIDMAKWVKFYLKKDHKYASFIDNTLTPQTIVNADTFFSKKESWMDKVFFPKSHFLTYGMGWFIHDYKGIKVCQAPGLTDGMNAVMALVPELGLGIVILNNLEAGFFSQSVLFHIIDHYRGEKTNWDKSFYDVRKKHMK